MNRDPSELDRIYRPAPMTTREAAAFDQAVLSRAKTTSSPWWSLAAAGGFAVVLGLSLVSERAPAELDASVLAATDTGAAEVAEEGDDVLLGDPLGDDLGTRALANFNLPEDEALEALLDGE